MWNWLNSNPTGQAVFSYIKVFLAVFLGMFLADGADVFAVSTSDLRVWLAAGLAAVLPILLNAMNPRDTRYGKKEVEEI